MTTKSIKNGLRNATILDSKSKEYADFLLKTREDIRKITNSINKRWGLVLTPEECEDIIQELCVFFHEKYQSGVYDSNRQTPAGYLWFHILGRIQKVARRKKLDSPLPAVMTADEADTDGDVDQSNNCLESQPDAFKNDRFRCISEILAKTLNEKDRQILQMRADGLSNDEIAESLQLSKGTVATRLCRAKKNFRSALEARGYHDLLRH